jgi:hypothetical protein
MSGIHMGGRLIVFWGVFVMGWALRVVLVMVMALMFEPSVLSGDEIEERLEKERLKQTAILERLEKTVNTRMAKAERLARANGTAADIQSLVFQKERYDEFGLLPSFSDAAMFKQRSTSYDRLVKAYRVAVRDYSKEMLDEKAAKTEQEMRTVWPAFLDAPDFGGWNPLGALQMDVGNGVLAITGHGDKSAFVTTANFSARHVFTVNLSATENVKAWVAIRVRDNQGRFTGYTSSILGQSDTVQVGKMGLDFDVKEIGVQSVVRRPNEFVEMKFAFDQSAAITTIVDGGHNGGMSSSVEPTGKFGFFVVNGTVIIKSVEVAVVPN